MELNKLIKERWSPRAFLNKKVEQEKIDLLFEAARWAPSSMNEQPWRFVYVTKGDHGYQNVFESIVEGNKPWAQEAPVLIVGLAKKNFDYKDRPNFHYMYDLGQAVAMMTIQAIDLGLYMHQMGGVDFKQLKENINTPEDHDAVVVMALGYKGDADQLSEPYKAREQAPRKRKAVDEFVTKNHF